MFDNYLYTYSDDRTIKVWNLNTNKCLETFTGHNDAVSSIEFSNNMLYSGSLDHYIRSWDLDEMHLRIRERAFMNQCDIESMRMEVYERTINARSKKKKGKKGKMGKMGKKKK